MQQRYATRAVLLLLAAMVTLLLGIAAFGLTAPTLVLEAAVIAASLVIDRVASPRANRWSQGAAGEERVGEILGSLGDSGWFALHDVDLGRGNIDHIAIGPAGLFTIETKSHRGRIRTDRIDAHMLRQAYAEAKVLERITGLRVHPLLVFSSAYLTPAVSNRNGVTILPARMLARHLQLRPGNEAPERVRALYERLAASLPA